MEMRTFTLTHNNITYTISLIAEAIDLETHLLLKIRYPQGIEDLPLKRVSSMLPRICPGTRLGNIFGVREPGMTIFKLVDDITEFDIDLSDSGSLPLDEYEIEMSF